MQFRNPSLRNAGGAAAGAATTAAATVVGIAATKPHHTLVQLADVWKYLQMVLWSLPAPKLFRDDPRLQPAQVDMNSQRPMCLIHPNIDVRLETLERDV